jgi:hypothetical protein
MVGGDAVNSSWADNTYYRVDTLTTFNSKLYAGLGVGGGFAEVWEYNGTSWTQIGGDGLNSSWSENSKAVVFALLSFSGKLYAGTGTRFVLPAAGDGELWEYNGTSWTKVGGDAVNSSWADSTYEDVYALASVNNKLYAGLSRGTGDAEVWQMRLGPVSYQDTKTLVLNVTSDFASGETLTTADLGFANFTALATPTQTLQLFKDGASDATADATDDKTKAVRPPNHSGSASYPAIY